MDQCAPRATVLRQVAPPLHVLLPAENRRDARLLERLVQRVPVRELGSPVGPRVADPRGEELAREPLVAHASNMPRPATNAFTFKKLYIIYAVAGRKIGRKNQFGKKWTKKSRKQIIGFRPNGPRQIEIQASAIQTVHITSRTEPYNPIYGHFKN